MFVAIVLITIVGFMLRMTLIENICIRKEKKNRAVVILWTVYLTSLLNLIFMLFMTVDCNSNYIVVNISSIQATILIPCFMLQCRMLFCMTFLTMYHVLIKHTNLYKNQVSTLISNVD